MENGPKILQRGGGLINQSMPSAPRPAQGNTTLSPLRQILLVAQDMPTAEKQRKALLQQGLRIVSRKKLSAIGLILSTFQVPEDIDIDEFLGLLQIWFPDASAEKNQRFRLLEIQGRAIDTHAYAQNMVGLRVPSQCRQAGNLAMLDSAVSGELIAVHGERLRLHDVTRSAKPPDNHGSAIASLLISDSIDYPGLLPAATLDVINVFAMDENAEPETRTDWLLYGFNLLAGLLPAPQAVNLSFGGRHSALLETVLQGLSKKMHLIAAAGNDGGDVLVYPAAYGSVYAVGAVDASGRLTRSSNRGSHVVLVAPGEDIWTRDGSGQGFYASGTSFAAPFVSAAMALLSQRDLAPAEYIESLGAANMVSFRDLCP
jgi:subtilisin family serine protease